jgi:hypothetical protein
MFLVQVMRTILYDSLSLMHIRLDLNEDRAILPKPRNTFELIKGNQRFFELEEHLQKDLLGGCELL